MARPGGMSLMTWYASGHPCCAGWPTQADQSPSGALARNTHQILLHTLWTILHRCRRRGVVTKERVSVSGSLASGANFRINGTLTITKQYHNKIKIKIGAGEHCHQSPQPPATATWLGSVEGFRGRQAAWRAEDDTANSLKRGEETSATT